MPIDAIIILANLNYVLHLSMSTDCMQNKETTQDKLQIKDIMKQPLFVK